MFWKKKNKSLEQEVEALKKEIMLLKHNVNLLSISCVVMQFDAETQCDALEHMDLDTEQVNLTLKMGHDYDQRLKKFILDTMAEDRRKRAKKKANGKENNSAK